MNRTLPVLLLVILCQIAGLNAVAAEADKPFLHPLFTDNAVLQRGGHVRIWGWTKPGETVRLRLDKVAASTKAAKDGRWLVSLKAPPTGGPYKLQVEGSEKMERENILIGDVWLCSGQSNMEWSVANSHNPKEEIANGKHPHIRLFTVPKRIAPAPTETVDASWAECSPETVKHFSAVAYYFGRSLREHDPKVPIGLIHSSWGGTIAEAWTSAEALQSMPAFHQSLREVQDWAESESGASKDGHHSQHEAKLDAWWKANDKNGLAKAQSHYDSSRWKVMPVPGVWETSALPDFDGLVWFRKVVTLPDAWVGKDLELSLGAIDDEEVTFVNGTQVGSTQSWDKKRVYRVPAKHWRAGENLIAVRVLDTASDGGFHGEASNLQLKPVEKVQEPPIPLAGYWEYDAGRAASDLTPLPRKIGGSPNTTTVLYNGMIAPLVPMTIKGAIWYQGESNASRPTQYRTLLPTMIADWRKQFKASSFPFHVVQLANFMKREDAPGESTWAALREAQALTAQRDPNVGLAVAIDIGEADDIHPRNKQDVGKRLAMAERGLSGPSFREMILQGPVARLRFDHAKGLTADGDPKGFAIAGADKKFVWAKAKIRGEEVLVTAPQIREIVAVRYGWGNNPECTLYNGAGLPAVPFRTDTAAVSMPSGFTSLFDGETLEGWKQINGTAKYKVQDGTIVGTTVKGSPNSFLCSNKRYDDFELQFEVNLINGELNSGCQIRSNSYANYKDGRVHGYQVEIATNGTSGFIYDEARRGWLSKDRTDPAAKAAFQKDGWNHYRILCQGQHMQTWVNGIPVADVTDSMTSEGFIGLQVHSVKGDPKWQVAWRNVWIREISKDRGEALFNGRDLNGWKAKPGGWGVQKGEILARLKNKAGYIWSEETFDDFVLDLEFKTATKCNSGVFFRADPKNPVQAGFEIQLFDSHGKDKIGKHDSGALYDALAPRINAARPAGEWNHLRVKAQGPHIHIMLNGEEVVRANLDDWKEARKNPDGSKNKFKKPLKDFPRSGHIGFQDHGRPVWFRNVSLKKLVASASQH